MNQIKLTGTCPLCGGKITEGESHNCNKTNDNLKDYTQIIHERDIHRSVLERLYLAITSHDEETILRILKESKELLDSYPNCFNKVKEKDIKIRNLKILLQESLSFANNFGRDSTHGDIEYKHLENKINSTLNL